MDLAARKQRILNFILENFSESDFNRSQDMGAYNGYEEEQSINYDTYQEFVDFSTSNN